MIHEPSFSKILYYPYSLPMGSLCPIFLFSLTLSLLWFFFFCLVFNTFLKSHSSNCLWGYYIKYRGGTASVRNPFHFVSPVLYLSSLVIVVPVRWYLQKYFLKYSNSKLLFSPLISFSHMPIFRQFFFPSC